MLLYLARQRVQVPRAGVTRQGGPGGERGARGGHGGVYVGRIALRHAGKGPGRSGVHGVEQLAARGAYRAPTDEVPELTAVPRDPLEGRRLALRRRAVVHRFEDGGDGGLRALHHHPTGAPRFWRCSQTMRGWK